MPTSEPHAKGGVGTPLSRHILAFSADRTLAKVRDAAGAERLRKVFESGSDADAEREQHVSDVLRGDGVVSILGVGREASTDRPFVDMELLRGRDLGAVLRDDGPMSLPNCIRVARGIAGITARIAALKSPEAPDGWVHRDVKPANVFVTTEADGGRVYLLDFEHATPANRSVGGRFTGGTASYSPPEAFVGVTPEHAFDVFGFGVTLLQMLRGLAPEDGRSAFSRRVFDVLVPPDVRSLCAACTDGDPLRRPSWSQVLDLLDRRDAPPGPGESPKTLERTLDGIRLALLAGDIDTSRHLVRAVPIQSRSIVESVVEAGQRLARCLDLSPARNADFVIRARGVESILRRFPGNAAARAERTELLELGTDRTLDAPASIKRHALGGDFPAARRDLETLCATLTALVELGPLPLPSGTNVIPPILRDPRRVLDSLERDLQSRQQQFRDAIAAIEASELTLDPSRTQAAVERASVAYGGASEITAQLKERLHAFEFAIGRIGGSATALDECERQLSQLANPVDLGPVKDLIDRCAKLSTDIRATNCRSLLQVLTELEDEKPHTAPSLAAARVALDAALHQLTSESWEVLERSVGLLQQSPIPIRPLSADVNRLDRLDIAGGLIDCESGTRSDFLDTLENLRIRVERARATRDRLARGAEEALDQGHLTTALFEMERVASHYEGDTAATGSMSDRFERAKRLKRDIQAALETNHAAAARYQAALDSATADESDLDPERLAILRERERALDFLCRNVPEERRDRYEADRNRIRFQIFERTALSGRARYDRSEGEAVRHEVAGQILRELALLVPSEGWDTQQLDVARATLEEFRGHRAPLENRSVTTPPNHSKSLGIAALVVVLLGAAGWIGSRWGNEARAAELPRIAAELEPAMHWPRDDAAIRQSLQRLQRFLDSLVDVYGETPPDSDVSKAARQLVAAASSTKRPDRGEFALLESALRDFQRATDSQSKRPAELLDRFARAAHAVGCVRATWNPQSKAPKTDILDHLKRTADLRSAIPAALAQTLRERARP